MKTLKSSLLLILSSFTHLVYGQGIDYLQQMGGTGYDAGLEMAIDGAGNTFIVGSYIGTQDFGGISMTAMTGGEGFLVKYDVNGVGQWGVNLDQVAPVDVKYDASGNVYVACRIVGISAPSYNLGGGCTATVSGFYIAKFDASGNCQWMVGPDFGNAEIHAIDIDDNGNVYGTGLIYGGTTIGPSTFTTNGGTDLLLMKVTSAGVIDYAVNYGGIHDDTGRDVWADSNGKVFVTGDIDECTDFGGQTLTVNGLNDFLLAGFTASTGAVDWAYNNGSADYSYGYSIVGDDQGGLYVAGSYTYAPVFGNSAITDDNKFFLAKFSDTGSLTWSQMEDASSSWTQPFNQGGPEQWMGNKLIRNASSGDLYITFASSGQANFGDYELNNGSLATYVAKHDANGGVLWAQQANSLGDAIANGIGQMPNGNLKLFGTFENDMWMGWDTINTPNSNSDMFMAELFDCPADSAWVTLTGDSLTANAGVEYLWYENGSEMWWETTQYLSPWQDGAYAVEVTDSNWCVYRSDDYLFVDCQPWWPYISTSNDTMYTYPSGSNYTYEWYKNDVLLPNDTLSYLTPTSTGNYYAIITTDLGCVDTTYEEYFFWAGLEDVSGLDFSISPNPAASFVRVEGVLGTEIRILNSLGVEVKRYLLYQDPFVMDVRVLTPGVYFIEVFDQKAIAKRKKLVVDR